MATAAPSTDSEAHLYFTLDDQDENQILELVKVDETGMYVRDNHQWVEIDPDADNERVWDRVILDVTPDAVPAFDQALDVDQTATVDELQDYVIEGDQ